jgi:hypothetical protein
MHSDTDHYILDACSIFNVNVSFMIPPELSTLYFHNFWWIVLRFGWVDFSSPPIIINHSRYNCNWVKSRPWFVVLTFPDLIQVVQFFSSVHGFFSWELIPESRIAHFEVGLGFSLVPEHLIGEGSWRTTCCLWQGIRSCSYIDPWPGRSHQGRKHTGVIIIENFPVRHVRFPEDECIVHIRPQSGDTGYRVKGKVCGYVYRS